jgi:serine/threonine protein kinase
MWLCIYLQENNVDMELVAMTLAEVASAMDYLHTHRITHRSVRLHNDSDSKEAGNAMGMLGWCTRGLPAIMLIAAL